MPYVTSLGCQDPPSLKGASPDQIIQVIDDQISSFDDVTDDAMEEQPDPIAFMKPGRQMPKNCNVRNASIRTNLGSLKYYPANEVLSQELMQQFGIDNKSDVAVIAGPDFDPLMFSHHGPCSEYKDFTMYFIKSPIKIKKQMKLFVCHHDMDDGLPCNKSFVGIM